MLLYAEQFCTAKRSCFWNGSWSRKNSTVSNFFTSTLICVTFVTVYCFKKLICSEQQVSDADMERKKGVIIIIIEGTALYMYILKTFQQHDVYQEPSKAPVGCSTTCLLWGPIPRYYQLFII